MIVLFCVVKFAYYYAFYFFATWGVFAFFDLTHKMLISVTVATVLGSAAVWGDLQKKKGY